MSNVSVPFDLGAAGEASALRLGDALFGRKSQPKSPKEALQPQSAPPPPPPPPPKKRRKSSPFLSAASGILSLLVIVAIVAALLDATLQRTLRTAGPLQADKLVVIPSGTPPGDIADQLESEGVIANKYMRKSTRICSECRAKCSGRRCSCWSTGPRECLTRGPSAWRLWLSSFIWPPWSMTTRSITPSCDGGCRRLTRFSVTKSR